MPNLLPRVLLGFLSISSAVAQDVDAPMLKLGGFGTAGVVRSSESRADFTTFPTKSDGAGATHRWSADVDSVVGAQLTADLTPQLSAVVQIVSELNEDHTYRPHAEWANVKYEIDTDFSLRIGRIALPLFLSADVRKVGYANPWVRPPVEVYKLTPFTNSDGADAIYRMRVGDTTGTFQASVGATTLHIAPSAAGSPSTSEVRALRTLAYTVEHGPLTAQINYSRARLTIPELVVPFDAFERLGPAGQAIARKYRVSQSLVTSIGLSASFDPGPWFVTGEMGRNDTHSVLGVSTGGYVTSGFRIARFTPYATVARLRADGNRFDPGVPLAGLPAAAVPAAVGLNGFLNSVLGNKGAQTSYSIGSRWDFAEAAALKLQYDRLVIDANSPGVLTNLKPGFTPGGRVNLFSATVDVVF